MRASAPTLPPVTSSIVLPCSFSSSVVGYSSVASVERPSCTSPSQSACLVLGELQRGIRVRAEAARRLVVLGVEARVLVQRLAVDGQALARAPPPSRRRPPWPRCGRSRRRRPWPRQRDRAAEGELLRQLGVDEMQVRAVHPLLLAEALVVELDEVLVLAVHDHEPPAGATFSMA